MLISEPVELISFLLTNCFVSSLSESMFLGIASIINGMKIKVKQPNIMNKYTNPQSLYRTDPIIGPRPFPNVDAASRYPKYLIVCSGSSMTIKLLQGITDIVLMNPCNDLKIMAVMTIIILF